MMKKNSLLLLFLLLSIITFGRKDINPSLNDRPLSFRENKGQIRDQYGAVRKDIDFILQVPELTLYIGSGQLHYQFIKKTPVDTTIYDKQNPPHGYKVPGAVSICRLDVILQNARKEAILVKEEPQKEQYHYYTAGAAEKEAEVAKGVQAYRKVIYKNIYPSIDWVLYVKGKELKYDFIVHPGGKVSDIQLKYTGAEKIKLLNDGSLQVSTALGSLTEEAPYVFEEQGKKKITAAFTLKDNIAGFSTAPYQGTLIIDPGVKWGTYFGGAEEENGQDVACDAAGNVYITGSTTSLSNIATTGAHQSVYSGAMGDAYLAKFDSLGQLQWATYYGGTSTVGFFIITTANTVSCDPFGHVYIAGMTSAMNGIATAGSYQPALGSNTFMQGFLAQFNSDGTRNWGTYYGASLANPVFFANTTFVYASACDQEGNVYIGCHTDTLSSTAGTLSSPGAHQAIYGGGETDGLLVKFDSSGNRLWATYYGGSNTDYIYAVACDDSNNVYITGSSGSASGIATPGTLESSQHEYSGGFVAKFNSSGVRQWGSYLHGEGKAISIDPYQHAYVAGVTQVQAPDTFIYTPGCHLSTLHANASYNGFLLQFNPQNGTRNWGTYYGAEAPTFVSGLACDPIGNVFLCGYTNSRATLTTETIATAGSHQDTLNAAPGDDPPYDAFLVQFDTAGLRKWATYYGGAATEMDPAVTCDPTGAIYLSGYTGSAAAIVTTGAYQSQLRGVSDVYLTRFLPVDLALVSIIHPENDTFCAAVMPLWVCVKNKGRIPKEDALAISYAYTGPVYDSLDTFFTNVIIPGVADTLGLGNMQFSYPGTYELTIYLKYTRDDNERNNDTLHLTMTVANALPEALIEMNQVGNQFYFGNTNPQLPDQYHWDFGDGTTSNEPHPVHQYAATDSFLVTLIVTNLCGSDTVTLMIKGSDNGTGIDQRTGDDAFAVYPNPAGQILYLKNKGNSQLQEYSIINTLGQVLLNGSLRDTSSINLSGLVSGSYIIRIGTNKGWVHKQFEVLHL